jgi:hypothetical protein
MVKTKINSMNMATADAVKTENTASSKKVRRMLFGLELHLWEQLMLASLAVAGLIAIAVFITTASVVILQRAETARAKQELDAYKLTVEGQVADAKKEGIEAGKSAGNALLRAAELEKQSQELRAANLKLEAQVAPRRLTDDQMSAMVTALAKSKYFGKGVKVSSHSTDVESAMLGAQIISILERAGMKPFDRRMTFTTVGSIGIGVLVSTSSGAYDLVDDILAAMPKSLLAIQGERPGGYPTILGPGEDAEPTVATIFVGVKPLPP